MLGKKTVIRDKETHIQKVSIYWQDINLTNFNIQTCNIRYTKQAEYVKQTMTELKREIYSNTIIVGVFNTLLSIMEKTPDRKSTEMTDLNNTIHLIGLTDAHRTFHPT